MLSCFDFVSSLPSVPGVSCIGSGLSVCVGFASSSLLRADDPSESYTVLRMDEFVFPYSNWMFDYGFSSSFVILII